MSKLDSQSSRGLRSYTHGRTANRLRHRLIYRAVLATLMMAPLAHAQSSATGSAGSSSSSAAALHEFRIAPGSLNSALNAFADVSGVQIAYAADLTVGRQSPGVKGSMSSANALDALLAGTGLVAQQGAHGGIVLSVKAQDVPASGEVSPEGKTLPPVVVSSSAVSADEPVVSRASTKTATALKDTPQSVTVIDRAQMDAQGVQSVAQALRYTPGVVAEARGVGERYDSVMLRGFGGFGGSASYVNFLDGLKLGRGLSYAVPQIDQYGLQRIEVLRGPSSILYGQASPGGVIVMESKMPEANHVNEIDVAAGTHNLWQGAFDLGGQLDDGKVLYRFVGLARDADTQVSGTKERRIYFAPSVTIKPDADTSLTLLASYQYDPENGYYGFLPRYGTVSANPNGQLGTGFNDGDPDYDTYKRMQASVGYQFEHRFNDVWTVRQNARYMHMWSNYKTVYSSGYTDSTQRYLNRLTSGSYEHVDSISVDNQAEAHFKTGALEHTVLFGLDYQMTMADRTLASGKAAALDILNPDYSIAIADPTTASYTRQRTDQLGLYAQDQVRFGKWSFVIGGREDWASTDSNELIKSTSTHQYDRAFTWRGGVLYSFDSGVTPYFSYSRSFQPTTSGTTSDGAPLKPTTGEQYEVGVKYQRPGSASFTTVSLFDLRQRNVSTIDPNNSNYRVQTGQVNSRGVEVEAHLALTHSLNAILAYTYTSAYVASATDSSLGHTPAAVPRQMASAWLDYTLHAGPLSGLGFGGGVRYIGNTYGAADNSFKVSSYTLVDLGAHYDWRNWRFSVTASNLFDREYVAACASATQCFYGLRRTVIGHATYQW
ncbi:iron complex outermembrane recepter protein [Paraburkholderia fungorum]|uniref:Iron complex outermembrane recepter protein n=1 Tax=Paraburkholderia fungorum TaxID=134537 RepID=A0A1H1ICM6_9BURK|nr:TonB-dependent siderophore receptor [Paraburkholderia fungorum]SDR35424.1 iron complex outermembrane recepter protein [Paraburkholderia fungorum]